MVEHPNLPRTVLAAREAGLRAVLEQDSPRPGDGGEEGEADGGDAEVERLRVTREPETPFRFGGLLTNPIWNMTNSI